MVRIADSWQVRSIRSVTENDSLVFHCAIDKGLVLTLAEGVDIISNLKKKLNELTRMVPAPHLIIGCDCILRRLEILENGLDKKFSELLNEIDFIGFNTYGEQFNSIHINQTLVGVIIGGDNGSN